MNTEPLSVHLQGRLRSLQEAKEKGIKVVGYFPGNYVPEEIIYASGAIPICLANGGNHHAADIALSAVPLVICPFARVQIGEMLSKTNPYYHGLLDMVVAPVTCQHLKKVAELWEYNGEVEVFKLGVPHRFDGDFELTYYIDRLQVLIDKLGTLTGNRITDDKLRDAIKLYNRMRDLLKIISISRQGPLTPISTLDFIKLNHASFLADPGFMTDTLQSLKDAQEKEQPVSTSSRPRLLLTGPNLTRGDYQIPELVEASGGQIVIEDFFEGIRYYWHNIDDKDNPLHALAAGCLRDRIPAAFMRSSTAKRFNFIRKLIADFNISGVIWYQLECCETYDQEAYFVNRKLREMGVPMLIVESSYDASGAGQLKTRISAFIELIQGVPTND